MSVDCRIVVGLTIDLFDKSFPSKTLIRIHKFIEEHPELDEYDYRYDEKGRKATSYIRWNEWRLARLVWVDKIIEPGNAWRVMSISNFLCRQE